MSVGVRSFVVTSIAVAFVVHFLLLVIRSGQDLSVTLVIEFMYIVLVQNDNDDWYPSQSVRMAYMGWK
jgi:hypothetical protein